MAHERKRHIEDVFRTLLGFSPIVGIFGHRQVGKTTFLASSIVDYRTLDDFAAQQLAHHDPKGFIQPKSKSPVAIDECQQEPRLFPSLKDQVRVHKRPGQFVLSGSVRFTSRQAIRESLAGRIALLEMLPFSVKEILGEPLSEIVPRLWQHKIFSHDSLRSLNDPKRLNHYLKHFATYLESGGLPGLCFIRNPQLQRNALNDLHDLILGRDLSLISDLRTPLSTLKRFLSHIAKGGFEPYVAIETQRVLGLAPQTQKKILAAMESIFLIRRIAIPRRKKECFILEDQLEELVYTGSGIEKATRLETAVYRNIRTQFMYRLDKNVGFEVYLTRDNARVPIVIRDDNHTLGIIVHEAPSPSLSEIRSAASFLKNHGNAKIMYLSGSMIAPRIIDERSLACSVASVL